MNSERPEPLNRLFPLFLKLENFRVLLIGGGWVGLEKLNAILNNAPATQVRIVSITFHEELIARAAAFENVSLVERPFTSTDLDNTDIVITALSDPTLSISICQQARDRKILINSADKPELCDFYLGSIVQRGNLKIAISTNGKSPTMAKRLKEWLNHVLPDELNDTLDQLNAVRERMRGDLKEKIEKLNELTKNLLKG